MREQDFFDNIRSACYSAVEAVEAGRSVPEAQYQLFTEAKQLCDEWESALDEDLQQLGPWNQLHEEDRPRYFALKEAKQRVHDTRGALTYYRRWLGYENPRSMFDRCIR